MRLNAVLLNCGSRTPNRFDSPPGNTEYPGVQSTSDILIVGGGVIGLTTAYRLAEQGVSVTVVDRRQPGQEASWAGAGMLPPGNLSGAVGPEAALRSLSHSLWEDLSAALKDRTGIDNGYRRCGAVETAHNEEDFRSQVEAWQAEGIRVDVLDREGLEQHVPDLNKDITAGAFLPDFSQARNPRHLKSLLAACNSLGVEIIESADRLALSSNGDRKVTAITPTRNFTAEKICVTAGAWSSQVLEPLGVKLPVRPVRGQVVQLKVPRLPFSCVIEQGRRYLVPRADGLILIGSTQEHVGFEKQTTAEGVAGLLSFAESLVPDLRLAEPVRCWAGLRPG